MLPLDKLYIKNEEAHWAVIALLRFFLSLVVVLGHYALVVKSDKLHIFGGGYLNPLSAVFGFFVLSGYSIAASLERETKGFYRRRFVRIWPLYLSSIVFGLLVYEALPQTFAWPIAGAISLSATSVIASLFMVQGIVSGPIPIIAPIWSLSAEWWYYMVSPWLKGMTSRIILGFIAISFVFFILAHHFNPSVHAVDGWSDFIYGKSIFGLLWIWLTGFLYYRYKGTPLGFVLLVAPSVFAVTMGRSTGVPLFITVFALVLSHEIHLTRKNIGVFNYFGDLSYPVYLFHMPVMAAVVAFGHTHNRLLILLSVVAASSAVLHRIDYPIRSLLRSNKGVFSALKREQEGLVECRLP